MPADRRWSYETFTGATMAAFPGLPPCMTLAEAERRVTAVLRYLADAGLLAETAAPRTWSLPPEPGPEVKAARTHNGDRLVRSGDGWTLAGSPRHKAGQGSPWPEMLYRFGPLTDATETGADQ